MDSIGFKTLAESLRQYRRADLRDFSSDVGDNPVNELYVDPLPGNAILETILAGNTTFILGRKGTGKSTVFARAQTAIRGRKELISVYIDVKRLHDLVAAAEPVAVDVGASEIDASLLRSHTLRKHFLGSIVHDLVVELNNACDQMSLLQRWSGKKRGYQELMTKLSAIGARVKSGEISKEELPVLQRIQKKTANRHERETQSSKEKAVGIGGKASTATASASGSVHSELTTADYAKSLEDKEVYSDYAEVILQSFPFHDILQEIIDLLDETGLKRLVIFFDDFSEIDRINQQLFVDVILSPLNNASNERVKLKVAGYPGRVYWGRIDPSKVDTIQLDFSELYKGADIQSAEASAVDYTQRLLERRFDAFKLRIADYFDDRTPLADFYRLIFQVTSNVPRLMGSVLFYSYLERVSKGQRITIASVKLAAEKYYNDVIAQYFDRAARFALEPFDRKLDRHNQKLLLRLLIEHAKLTRNRIRSGEVGGTYFKELSMPPVSHFAISTNLESILASLEFNFLVTKYSSTRDKDSNEVSVYAMCFGLCEAERILWGYPPGRQFRGYFVQRCFDYNQIIHGFLAQTQTIRCKECGASHAMEKKSAIETYNWRCPDCLKGTCEIVQLGDDFANEIAALNEAAMLEEVELDILNVLNSESRTMRAGEVSLLLDINYQLVGKRTSKLQDKGLVTKSKDSGGNTVSRITDTARQTYFNP